MPLQRADTVVMAWKNVSSVVQTRSGACVPVPSSRSIPHSARRFEVFTDPTSLATIDALRRKPRGASVSIRFGWEAGSALGAAGEPLGSNRYHWSNIQTPPNGVLTRCVGHGCMLSDLIPNVRQSRLSPLIERFIAMFAEFPVFADAFGAA